MAQDPNQAHPIAKELALTWEQLRRVCEPDAFPYPTTEAMEPLLEVFGQDRAVRAIHFAIDIASSGYNVFLAGPPGTGKTIILKRILREIAAAGPVPDDVCYVHNFRDEDSPRVVQLPAGTGARLRNDMEELIQDLRDLVPRAFEGSEYEERQSSIAERKQEERQVLLQRLQEEARAASCDVRTTPMGIQAIPIRDGNPLTQEQYAALPAEERSKVDQNLELVQKRTRDFMLQIKSLERELKGEIKDFNDKVALNVLGALMRELHERYSDHEKVLTFLEDVQRDILENIDQFRSQEDDSAAVGLRAPRAPRNFTRYKINLIVDNSGLEGAPVVVETNPTYNNLVGRVEHRAQFGALITDVTMIRPGALTRANGGYLVVNIEDVLRNPGVYDALKRAVKNQEIRIEELAERIGLFSSQTLRPEPIPLSLKVCLIGNPKYYHLLYAYDEEFRESFKVKADFDHQSDRNPTAVQKFGSFVARLVSEEGLPHFDRSAICAIVDEASRWVEDQEKISLQFGAINDLVRQAAYWARKQGAELVQADHVQRAVDEIEFRSSLVKERVQELTERGVLTIDTDGEREGEVNGLAVHMLGDYLFGRPTRISARVALGAEGVINVERRANLSHSTHDKGVLILTGFLTDRFAQDTPLSISATLTFEQSYAEVAGDSASSTELYALLSILAGLPLKQSIAVTGSVNQNGDVQAVGGVNYKIEGFFDLCDSRGLTGEQGVLIPKANVQHLMLKQRVVDAVKNGKFQIWAADHVDQGIELLTGVPAGKQDEDGVWTSGSVSDRIARRVATYNKKLRGQQEGPTSHPDIVVYREEDISELPPPPRPPDRPPA